MIIFSSVPHVMIIFSNVLHARVGCQDLRVVPLSNASDQDVGQDAGRQAHVVDACTAEDR